MFACLGIWVEAVWVLGFLIWCLGFRVRCLSSGWSLRFGLGSCHTQDAERAAAGESMTRDCCAVCCRVTVALSVVMVLVGVAIGRGVFVTV